MSIKSAILGLYRKIPNFECITGCADCCGPVPFAKWEWGRIKDQRVSADGRTCPYSSENGCQIYEMRPLMCRMFGAVNTPLLTCPKGCGPKKKLSDRKAAKIVYKYPSMIDI